MAGESGPPPDDLDILERVARGDEARRYGFLALVRLGEMSAKHLPRLGRARKPADNIVDLAHAPTLSFPGPVVESVTLPKAGSNKPARPKLRSYFLGLTGPMGALPLHLTEIALFERLLEKVWPFNDFLDLLSGRFLQFFFRAWADSQPVVQADREDDDRFARYLAEIGSIAQGVPSGARLDVRSRLPFVGAYVSARSPAVIGDCLSALLGMRARVQEYVARWRPIADQDQTALGVGRESAMLGRGAVLGRRVRVIDDAFRVVLSPGDIAQYEDFLPPGDGFALAREMLDAIAPVHLDWEIELEIAESALPADAHGVCLSRLDGKARLGWTSWLAPKGDARLRADLRLTRGHAMQAQEVGR